MWLEIIIGSFMLCCLFGGDRLKHVGGDRFVVYYNTDHKISKPVQLLLFLFCCFQYLFAKELTDGTILGTLEQYLTIGGLNFPN